MEVGREANIGKVAEIWEDGMRNGVKMVLGW